MSQPSAEEQLAGEYRDRNVGTGGRMVVVGVKLDSQSRELLTWSLVKQAQPGDSLVALHILTNNEIMDRDGKSSLLSLVNSFDSVLAVYEGFCNLKQVDLKLKICRGASIRKVLVREAKAYGANEIIVGTSRNNHTVKSSSSIAKYCAKKLSKSCSIIAVNSGKIVFHRHSPSSTSSTKKGSSDQHKSHLLSLFHKSLSFNPKVLKNGNTENCNQSDGKNLELALVKYETEFTPSALKDNCRICSLDSVLPVPEVSCANGDDDEDNSMALVPVQKLEGSSSSTSLLLRELPELRPGWPLLRRAILSSQLPSKRSRVHQISVVQWAMKLPTRDCLQITNTDSSNDGVFDDQKDGSFEVNVENGAIVCVGGDGSQADLSSSPNHDSIRLPKELEGFHEKYSATCRLFQYQELLSATASFKPENMIGKGGNSKVYKGCLPDGKEIAVKILKSSEDVLKEFVLEIEIITALRHQNIISLFGFCFEDNNLLLVYDFLSRGSLEDNLHGNKKNVAFGWSVRYKIAVGVAEALVYLHSSCDQKVIHRDVKSSNILLSDDFEPQLSDFGLAKWVSTTSSHITCSDVAGTFGYLAPEYFMYGKVTDKIDVYAFGVVLLELLSGRKPISNEYPKGEESLVMWAKPILSSGKFRHLLDKSLGYNYDADQMERMALASTLCIRRVPLARPHMSSINGDCDAVHEALFQVTTCLRNHYFRDAFPGFQDHGPPFPPFMGRRELSPSGRYSSFNRFDAGPPPHGGFHPHDDRPPFMHDRPDFPHPMSERMPSSAPWGPQGMEVGGPLGYPDFGAPQRRMGGFVGGSHQAIITNTTVEVVVPRTVVPSIYGEEGGCLKQIREISDAKITITDPKPGAKETLIIISGTPEQAHAAQSLIQAFVISETEGS